MNEGRTPPRRFPLWWLLLFATTFVAPAVGWLAGEISAPAFAMVTGLVAGQAVGALLLLRAARRELGQATESAEAAIQGTVELQRREVLLGSVLEATPAAMVLCDVDGKVTYSNRAARDLLADGNRFVGKQLTDLLGARAPQLRDAVGASTDSMVALDFDKERETFLVSTRKVLVAGRNRKLHMIRRMTGEVNRSEVESWKKLIRVLNHEMNNSLAPIKSLVHSARLIAKNPDKHAKLDGVLETIAERAEHLRAFLDNYAEFARLPKPVKRQVDWSELLARLAALHDFELVGEPPERPGFLDPGQLEQVLINLFKNAQEAGSRPEVSLASENGGVSIRVSDRGPGMTKDLLEKALLPFFSTKGGGTGLGLALSRDIVEEHGGEIRLQNRAGGGLTVHCWLPDPDTDTDES